MVAEGVSSGIGLHSADTTHYQEWNGYLSAREAGAKDIAVSATSWSLRSRTLLTKEASWEATLDAISVAAEALAAGDDFIVSRCRYGAQLFQLNSCEDDGEDETWCLYGRQPIDDELDKVASAPQPHGHEQ